MRASSGVVLCAGALAALSGWAGPTVLDAWAAVQQPGRAPGRFVEHAVVVLATGALAAALLWLSVSLLVCTLEALRAADGPLREGLFRPRVVRVLVAGALGTLVTTGATSAMGAGARHPALPGVLDGMTVPDRSYGVVHTHRVRAGESLWSIAADHANVGAPADVVARRWPRLYRLNQVRVGGDPQLIHPGTHLRLPTWGAAPTRGGNR